MSAEPSLRWLRRAEETLGTILLALIFLSIALQVVTRFVLQSPPFWTEEVARYLFVWVVCIGSAEVVRVRGHITMDIFAMMLGPRVWQVLQVVLNSVVCAVLIVLVWYGTLGALRADKVMSVAIGIPESFLYGALPVGAALMSLRLIALIVLDLKDLVRGTSHTTMGGGW